MRVTVPARYLPFVEEGRHEDFRWRSGLRPLELRDWIELGPSGEAAIAAKADLLDAHPEVVLGWLPGIEAEAREVADAVVEHLRTRWPERSVPDEPDPGRHPLDVAGRLVPEDLVLLVPRDGRLVVGGGSVCFPNRWDLRSKLGRTLAETHAPVPRLNEQLGTRLDRFLDRLRPERGFWRLGWGLLDTPEWYTPPGAATPATHASPAATQATPATPVTRLTPASPDPSGMVRSAIPDPPTGRAGRLHLRVERETVRRFPRTGAILFTIRTHVTPLADVVGDPEAAAHLAARLAQMPSDVRVYKGIDLVADELVEELCDRAPGWRPGQS